MVKKMREKRKRFIVLATCFVLTALGSIFMLRLQNREYRSYHILSEMGIEGSNAVDYLAYDDSVIKYSKDGVVALDKAGSLLWNSSYEMSNPMADTCGKYVVIADRDAKLLHIFNKEGHVNRIVTLYDIMKVEVAKQGVVAAMMETDSGNNITLFDKDGTILAEKGTSVKEEGYPLDFSLSEDGKKLVLSYLSYTGGKLINTVSFYNFGRVGQNYTWRIVGGWPYEEGTIIPRVAFINNNTVCAFADNRVLIYSMKEIPREPIEIALAGKLQSIFYNEEYIGLVLQADGTVDKQLLLYNLEGQKVLNKDINLNYEKIALFDKELIMYDNRSCLIMKINGRTKFKYNFDGNIETILPINNLDQYYLAKDRNLYEIQLEE